MSSRSPRSGHPGPRGNRLLARPPGSGSRLLRFFGRIDSMGRSLSEKAGDRAFSCLRDSPNVACFLKPSLAVIGKRP